MNDICSQKSRKRRNEKKWVLNLSVRSGFNEHGFRSHVKVNRKLPGDAPELGEQGGGLAIDITKTRSNLREDRHCTETSTVKLNRNACFAFLCRLKVAQNLAG